MAINIRKLIEEINARIDAGTTNPTETNRFSTLNKFLTGYQNAFNYDNHQQFDSASDTNEGNIIYSRDSDQFYISHRDQWKPITLGSLLSENRKFPGDDFGFVSGGLDPSFSSLIERFPFSNFTNALTLGNLTVEKFELSGQSSEIKGYTTAGKISSGAVIGDIEKFDFQNTTSSSLVGDLLFDKSKAAGLSTNQHQIGFSAGGDAPSIPIRVNAMTRIYAFPFANETQSSIHGTLYVSGSFTRGRSEAVGISDKDYGYVAGGINEFTSVNISSMEKFRFVNYVSSLPVSNLTAANSKAASNASETHGYVSGGFDAFSLQNIERFSFTSPHAFSDIGDLSIAKRLVSGQSSVADGYISGGFSPSISTIEKYPFSAAPVTTIEAGDLTGNRHNTVGHQV